MPALLALSLVALLATGAAALASTLTGDGSRLTWTADAGEANTLTITDPADGTLRIASAGDPVADPLPANCSDASGAEPAGTVTDCTGYAEADFLAGDGDDTLDASGLDGAQRYPLVLDGGAGDDTLTGGHGGDRMRGGDGLDRLVRPTSGPGDAVSITQNGAADDGRAGEADDIAGDIEVIEVTGEGDATVTTTAATNQIDTGAGNDTVDAGDGNDFVATGAGNDTVNARDGFADFVSCGEGTDTANVDQFDIVRASCETVDVENLPNNGGPPDDAPPKVSWVTPAEDGEEMSHNVSTLRVNATDDRAVTQVVFRAGTRVLCTDTTVPYDCAYTPTEADVGRNTLVATAFDEAQQTGTDLRFTDVDRFTPAALTSRMRPKRDTILPYEFTARGRLLLPRNVSIAEGCRGRVTVRYKVGRTTISTRRAKVGRSCRYTRRVEFNQPRRLTRRKLRVLIRFNGNRVLEPRSAETRKVRVR
jgi:Ca2+-binding RTX toxin-like protein